MMTEEKSKMCQSRLRVSRRNLSALWDAKRRKGYKSWDEFFEAVLNQEGTLPHTREGRAVIRMAREMQAMTARTQEEMKGLKAGVECVAGSLKGLEKLKEEEGRQLKMLHVLLDKVLGEDDCYVTSEEAKPPAKEKAVESAIDRLRRGRG